MCASLSRSPRVTVVEDDLSLLNALAFALEAEGFDVTALEHGRRLLTQPPEIDCLVVDLRLGDADGLTLVEDLRAVGCSPPAILITTNPDQRCRRRAAQAGIEIVEKPLIGPELVASVCAALERAR